MLMCQSEDLTSRVSFSLASLGWLHLLVSTSNLLLERVKLTLGSSEGAEFSTYIQFAIMPLGSA